MKKLTFLLLFFIFCISLSSQTPSINIVFDGDSQTSFGAWPAKIVELLRSQNYTTISTVNYAVSGQTTSQMTNDVVSQVVPRYNASYDKNIVLYYIGYNDTWAGNSVDAVTLHNRLVNYYNTLASAGFEVIMINLPDGYNRTGISVINNMYSQQHSDICDIYVNCRESGGVFENYTNTLYYRDNVHLSVTGSQYLAEHYVYPRLLELLDAQTPPPPSGNSLLTGIVSYYKLDELSGNVKDETGYNPGTISSGTTRTTGRINGAYYFDNNGDYLTLSRSLTLKTATYSFWINITNIADDLLILGNNGYYSRIFIGSKNNLKIETNTNGQEFGFYTGFSGNTWYHVALVRDNNTVTFYRNGVNIGTASIPNSAELTLSQIGYNGRSFRGKIDEIGIWNRALTAAEVVKVSGSSYPFGIADIPPASPIPVSGIVVSPSTASVFTGSAINLTAVVSPDNAANKNVSWVSNNTAVATVNSTGVVTGQSTGSAIITATTQDGGRTSSCQITVASNTNSASLLTSIRAYYKLDEISGNARDEVGSNSGIVSGGITRVAGRVNGAYFFDSNSDYITLSSPITQKTATYSFWIRLLSITEDLLIMGNNAYYSRIFIGAKNNIKLETNTNGQEFAFYHSLSTGIWYHIVLVRQNDLIRLYRNGVLTGTSSISNSSDLTISQIGFNGRSFRGTMDEIGIWDRALSTEEILLLHSGSVFPFSSLKSTDNSLEAQEEISTPFFYPNPASDRIYLHSTVIQAEIYDQNGKLVSKGKNVNSIDISALSDGMYLIRLFNEDSVYTDKLIIR